MNYVKLQLNVFCLEADMFLVFLMRTDAIVRDGWNVCNEQNENHTYLSFPQGNELGKKSPNLVILIALYLVLSFTAVIHGDGSKSPVSFMLQQGS